LGILIGSDGSPTSLWAAPPSTCGYTDRQILPAV
jgi:hypothetical protein